MYGVGLSPVAHGPLVSQRDYGPKMPVNLERTGENVDNTPNFSTNILSFENRQLRARFFIYEDSTLVDTVDSSLITQGGTATAEYSNSLAGGDYEVTAVAITDQLQESTETEELTFRVTSYVAPQELALYWHTRADVLPVELEFSWNVTIAGQRDFVLNWQIKKAVSQDIILPWRLITYWRRVNYDDSDWTRVL